MSAIFISLLYYTEIKQCLKLPHSMIVALNLSRTLQNFSTASLTFLPLGRRKGESRGPRPRRKGLPLTFPFTVIDDWSFRGKAVAKGGRGVSMNTPQY